VKDTLDPQAGDVRECRALRCGGRLVSVVPSGAVQSFEGDTVVIAAAPRGEGMQLQAIRVRVGRRTGTLAEILSGVDTGTVVIVGGASVAKAEILKRRGG
jgi:hypothetical protein